MKKVLTLILCLAMLLSALPAFAQEGAPGAQDAVNGFVLKSTGTIDMVGATTYMYEHEKSGASVLYIENGDTNRAFNIIFKTPALDNTGAPHVFEHAVLGGSDKYPAQNIVFALSTQTYNTYVNGMTGNTYTMYPVASLSEEQLLKMMDVYMAGALHPMLLTEPRLLAREAWRYELPDADAPITLSGTVYSEMLGSSTLARTAQIQLLQTLYPGSIVGNNPGGDPEYIPELTQEQLTGFHETYYHPSNALVILYGDLDCERFLKALDEDYFSHYERRDISVEDGVIDVPEGLERAQFEFPVERDSPATDASVVQYGFALDEANTLDKLGFSLLADIMMHESSPLTAALREALPGSSASAYIDSLVSMPYVAFNVSSANAGDEETLQRIVDQQLADFAENGFDREIIDAVIAQARFSTLMMPEMSNLGVNLSASLGAYWSLDGNVNYFNDFSNGIKEIDALADDGYFEGLTRRLMDAARRALIVTMPVPGLAEEQATELAAELAKYKASLSEDEIAQMVADTAELAAWSAEETPKELVKQIQAVTVQDLPEEWPTSEVTDEVTDGVRRLSAVAEVDEIGLTALALPTDFARLDQVPYLALYGQLLGSMPTENYTREQVSRLISQYLNGFGVSASTQEVSGSDAPLYRFFVQWTSLMDHYDEDLALVDEVLFHTDFDATPELIDFVKRAISSTRQSISGGSVSIQLMRSFASAGDAQYAYMLKTGGLDYYEFLKDVDRQLAEDPAVVVAELNAIREALRNRAGAISMFAGNAEGIEISRAALNDYFAAMPEVAYEPVDYSAIELPMQREAIVIDSKVQFNMLFATTEQLDIEPDGRLEPIGRMLYDSYLVPILRHQMGAYSPQIGIGEEYFLAYTFRDPNLAATFDVYAGMGEYLRTLSVDQTAVDPYILSCYSAYAMPVGQLNGAFRAMNRQLEGKTDEEMLDYMRQIKSLKAEDIAGLSVLFDRWNEVGAHTTSGAQSAIEQDATLFDQILMPLAESENDSLADAA